LKQSPIQVNVTFANISTPVVIISVEKALNHKVMKLKV